MTSIADTAHGGLAPDEATRRKRAAQDLFRQLRASICTRLEQLEAEFDTFVAAEHAPPTHFRYRRWQRRDNSGLSGGGGHAGQLRGHVFEKAGVNISTVWGRFDESFRHEIPGAIDSEGAFWASGLSVVIHARSPFVPAIHMNLRMLMTARSWFGGGMDLNPSHPRATDTRDFHAALRATCERFNPNWYNQYHEWCARYFWVPHRNRARGVGGIFFDQHNSQNWEHDLNFVKAVGLCFLDIYPLLVHRRWKRVADAAAREQQLRYRGLYAEFNLLYDRGTKFGLRTGGHSDSVLMSLPPQASWD